MSTAENASLGRVHHHHSICRLPTIIMCLHSHHLLLGVLEALGDEVERLVLGDRVLGHSRLLGVETLQLGLAWNKC